VSGHARVSRFALQKTANPAYDAIMTKLGIPKMVTKRGGYLDGKFLLAMPGMSDERFEKSLIYLCAHSDDGAMGLIINKPAENMSFPGLLKQLGLLSEEAIIRLPDRVGMIPVLRGGPVETGRGFVLHSSDFHIDSSTLPISKDISLTATLDVLRALAEGDGPATAMLALGYAGWAPGQLEGEMQANGWLHCDADIDLIFSVPVDKRYGLALKRLGIDPAFLSAQGGHA
jgi:putative transcriptional regulator